MIIVTCDKESEYQWMRAIMEAGEVALGTRGIDALNRCLDIPIIPYRQIVTYRQSESYKNDIENHVVRGG